MGPEGLLEKVGVLNSAENEILVAYIGEGLKEGVECKRGGMKMRGEDAVIDCWREGQLD